MATPDAAQGLKDFFDTIWRNEDGVVYLPVKENDPATLSGNWKMYMFQWPLKREGIVEHVLRNTSLGHDVYYGPAIYKKPQPGQKMAPTKEWVKGTSVVWAEFDGNAPQDWADTPVDLAHGAHSGSQGHIPGAPSLRVQSSDSTKQHVYWMLDEFVSGDNIDRVEDTNRAISYAMAADTSGWDITQILRPPFTTNYKYENHPEVHIIENLGTQYSLNKFGNVKAKDALVSSMEGISETELPSVFRVIADNTWDAEILDMLDKSVTEFGDRDRSAALMRLGYYCAEQGISIEESFVVIKFLDDKLGKFKHRTDRNKRYLDIIDKAHQRYPTAVADVDPNATIVQDNKEIYGFEELINADFHVDWMFEDFIPAEGLALFFSSPGVGKTQLAMRAGINGCLGKDFIGWKSVRKHRILFLSLEMGRAPTKHFFKSMSENLLPEEIQTLQRNFIIAPLGYPIPLGDKFGRARLENLIKIHKPEGVIIDSLGKVMTGKLTDDEEARHFFEYLKKVRQEYGVYFLIIHHNRKAQGDNKRPKELSDLYGSQYIGAEPDVIVSLWKEPGSKIIEINEVKNRLALQSEPFAIERVKDLDFERVDRPENLTVEASRRGRPPGSEKIVTAELEKKLKKEISELDKPQPKPLSGSTENPFNP